MSAAAAATATSSPPPQRSPAAAERRQWYLGSEGERRGPYVFTEIVAMAGADRVDAEDLLWRPGFREWVQADSIAGLLSPPPIPPMTPGRASAPRPLPVAPAPATATAPTAAQPRSPSDWEWARAAIAALDNFVPEDEEAENQTAETAPQAHPTAQAEQAAPEAVLDALPDAVPVEEEYRLPVATAPTPDATAPVPAAEAHDVPNSETERLRSLVGGLAAQAIEPKRSYIARHWHGELSFTRSLLVNGVLLTAAIGGAYEAIALGGPEFVALIKPLLAQTGLDLGRLSSLWESMPLWVVATARLAPWFAAAGVYLWSIVGIVRAARNRA